MSNNKNYSKRKDLIIFSLTIFLVLSVLLAVLFTAKQAVKNTSYAAIRENTAYKVQELSDIVEAKKKYLFSLAPYIDLDKGKVDPLLSTFAAQENMLFSAVYNCEGVSLYSQFDDNHISYSKSYVDGQVHVSNSYYGVSNIPQITIEVPLISSSKNPGSICGTYPLEQFFPERIKNYYGDMNGTYIISSSGKIIFPVGGGKSNLSGSNILDNISGNDPEDIHTFSEGLKSGMQQINLLKIDGTEYTIFSSPLKDMHELNLVELVPVSVLMANANELDSAIIISSVLALLAILLHSLIRIRTIISFEQNTSDLTYRDQLTGILNLTGFCNEAEELLRQEPETAFAIMYFDIKNFRYINDNFGLDYGDSVLKFLAEIFCKNSRTCLQARVSGDIFIVMLRYTTEADIQAYFLAIETQFSDVQYILPDTMQIKICAGVYCIEPGLRHDLQVREYVDKASLTHKELQRSSVNLAFYTKLISDNQRQASFFENSMHSALEKREFIIYLQPKISLKDNSLVGAEALVRWQHPERGLIMPNQFIPLFERNGFIKQLDRHMMKQCCTLLHNWSLNDKIQLPCISVNVSRKLLSEDSFLYDYTDMKTQFGIPNHKLELEFTESLILNNADRMMEFISYFRSKGFLCAIDDFGSGYSSLNMLKDIPFDVLKLDRAFFNHGLQTERERIVVRSIIDMARELSIQTVAEGVDNKETIDFLRENGCDIVQGFYYSKPIPVDEFEEKYLFPSSNC